MLPINLVGDGRCALIVGGGAVGRRKAATLTAAGFTVRVSHAYSRDDLEGADLVVAATDDEAVNAAVVADARAARVLVCDATDPSRGDFTMPATVRVGELTFAVDSGGSSPAFSKRVARELEERFGPSYDAAARTLSRMRSYVQTVVPRGERAGIMRELAELPVDELARMNPIEAEHVVEAAIERQGNAVAHTTHTAVCATRASALALTQSRWVAARLAERGTATTLLHLTTTGDIVQDRPVAAIGTDNVWVKELEAALLDERAGYAVHSCKDLPGELTRGMHLAAITSREDVRDAFCSERYASFDDLPPGAVVGTSSPRRRAQLRALRADLRYEDVRGNVDTRLRKLRDGKYDAIVLAMAGLNRLNLRATHTQPFEPDRVVPAVAQGALAVETLATNADLSATLREACNDATTELCVRAERAALRALRAGCNAPLGIHARLDGTQMTIDGAYAVEQRLVVLRARVEGDVTGVDGAEALGERLARSLEALRQRPARLVALARSQDRPSRIATELRLRGVEVVELREDSQPPARVPDLLAFPSSGSVAAARAYLASLRNLAQRPMVAAMGERSGAAARDAGFDPDFTSPEASIEAFVSSISEGLARE